LRRSSALYPAGDSAACRCQAAVHDKIRLQWIVMRYIIKLLIGCVALPSKRQKIETLGIKDDKLHGVFNAWNQGERNGCLLIA
jgi:hypothetical protein